LSRSLELWAEEAGARQQRMARLRDTLENSLRNELPDLVINGGNSPRLPNTSNLSFPGVDRQKVLMALDLAGIQCSSGSACASGSSQPSHVLGAMGLAPEVIAGSIRLSLGADSSESEITEAVRRISLKLKDLR
jgi:cysteine desulfurase